MPKATPPKKSRARDSTYKKEKEATKDTKAIKGDEHLEDPSNVKASTDTAVDDKTEPVNESERLTKEERALLNFLRSPRNYNEMASLLPRRKPIDNKRLSVDLIKELEEIRKR